MASELSPILICGGGQACSREREIGDSHFAVTEMADVPAHIPPDGTCTRGEKS